ncbi:MAG: hypothetical protein M5U30_00055 [Burkholderiaceae bacterium]|nr:hypothetical protein [Burkholderiaceae bacterium]
MIKPDQQLRRLVDDRVGGSRSIGDYRRRLITGQVTGQVLEEVERLVLEVGGPMKRAQIQQALGLRHEDHFRDAYLPLALATELLAMTVLEKPGSSRQPYRLTDKRQELRTDLLRRRRLRWG